MIYKWSCRFYSRQIQLLNSRKTLTLFPAALDFLQSLLSVPDTAIQEFRFDTAPQVPRYSMLPLLCPLSSLFQVVSESSSPHLQHGIGPRTIPRDFLTLSRLLLAFGEGAWLGVGQAHKINTSVKQLELHLPVIFLECKIYNVAGWCLQEEVGIERQP